MFARFSISLLLIVFNLSACVEVRDKDESGDDVKTMVSDEQNLTIDQPFLVIEGRLVPLRSFIGPFDRNKESIVEKTIYIFKYNHLNFKEGGIIYTMGYDVKFEVDELDAFNGLISTFPPNSEANPGLDGASGGNLELVAKKARGILYIAMLGEKGGRGFRGPAPDESMRGTRLDGGMCTRGAKGRKGATGFRGGNGGTATLVIQQDDAFSLNVSTSGGQGGRGGEGGDGGEPWTDQWCRKPYLGRDLYGPQGDEGEQGLPGGPGVICSQLGNRYKECR